VGRKAWREEGKRQQKLAVDMSHRASWDEAWKRYAAGVFHNWSKEARGPGASEVGSPMEGQAHRRSGAARILGIGKSGGRTPPHPTQGSLEKGRGLVPDEAKSEPVVPGIRHVVGPGGGTHAHR